MQTMKLALRNLTREKRRAALVSAAIAFCFGISLAIGALANGTGSMGLENWSRMSGGHLFIRLDHREHDKSVVLISDDRTIRQALTEQGIPDSAMFARSAFNGTLLFAGTAVKASIVGIGDAEYQRLSTTLPVVAGSFEDWLAQPQGIMLAEQTARRLGIAPGDEIQLTGMGSRGQRNVMDCVVSAIYASTKAFDTDNAWIKREYANQFLGIPDSAMTVFTVWLADLSSAPQLAESLHKALSRFYTPNTDNVPNIFNNVIMRNELVADERLNQQFSGERFSIKTIQQNAAVIMSASNFIRAGGLLMLGFILLVTVIGLNNNFRMIILERTREIGTMRALGFQREGIKRLFMVEGIILLSLGLIGGLLFGLALIIGTGLVTFPIPEYMSIMFPDQHVPFKLDMWYFLLCSVLIGVTVMLAMLIPAGRAANIAPAEALRETH